MNVIIPMMGVGQRFREVGYLSSKPLIKAHGKEILFWLLDNIDCNSNNVVIVHRSDIESERLTERLRSRYHDKIKTIVLNENTQGAAHTIKLALENHVFNLNEQFVICDSDTFYDKNHINSIPKNKNSIFYFEDTGNTPIYSYIEIENEKVKKIIEKSKISNFASVGTYCFKDGLTALKYIDKIMNKSRLINNEYYISTVFQEMIEAGEEVYAQKTQQFTCLGTPSQLQGFKTSEKLRFCFDLDNTLVSEPKIAGDYTTVEPIIKNIEFLKYLKSNGHTIILQTARRMKTHGGNVGRLVADIGKITFETLDKFEIPYDEIYFGKPYADFYIDDKAINAYDDLEKLTGVYCNEMISRDYNNLDETSTAIIKSSSNDAIRGELYWYLNSPDSIKYLFPKLISHKEINNSISLELEKIDGPTFSKMLVTGILQKSHLEYLVDSLNVLHSSEIENKNIDILLNYSKKLKERYSDFNFQKTSLTDKIYSSIMNFLLEYENSNIAKRGNIHGDPVFTNIIIDKNNRIKFIDMRGFVGNTLTITGDINYDYSKVYQSLIGYDFIIRKQIVDENKLNSLRNFFVKEIQVDEKILKGLTASLIFTCVPMQPDSIKLNLINLALKLIEEV
jgi:capsule biosynthesis phosphatase